MYILGFGGGPNAVHESTFEIVPGGMHDASAVLLRDGEVIAAIEQERLDRLKHSHKRPFDAIRFCLRHAGIDISDVDRFAFHDEEWAWNDTLYDYQIAHRELPVTDIRGMITHLLYQEFQWVVPPERLTFVNHHVSHAISAVSLSGMDECLVVTLDGQGDEIAGLIAVARGTDLEVLASLPYADSLGFHYLGITQYLGYRMFDEYKVMGLAPYGDPDAYRELFRTFYTLEPNGKHRMHPRKYRDLQKVTPPRRASEPFGKVHQDLAAALQESLEEIAFHILRHYQQETGQRQLCLAGGVAHNCTLNGKILGSGLFDRVFVQPASHDAGCSLGAALHVYHQESEDKRTRRLSHVYWGSDLGTAEDIETELRAWSDLIEIEKADDVCEAAAEMLASGQIIGWAQGRSEFGPRALGNRSILGDPRPPENKDVINGMVKKREGYRPFAPSVLVERAREFFEYPESTDELPFMIFTVQVKKEMQQVLGAVTHVDGSARVQTVSRDANERFWRLIDAFGRRTGVPVLLNTSFNNNAEPIVDSVRDAVTCFLTTELHGLAVGDFIVRKKAVPRSALAALVPSLPPYAQVRRTRSSGPDGLQDSFLLSINTGERSDRELSPSMYELLLAADGHRSLAELLGSQHLDDHRLGLIEEIWDLWSGRYLTLAPR